MIIHVRNLAQGLAEQFLGRVSEQLLMSTSSSPLLLKDIAEDEARVQLMCFCSCHRRYSGMVTHTLKHLTTRWIPGWIGIWDLQCPTQECASAGHAGQAADALSGGCGVDR